MSENKVLAFLKKLVPQKKPSIGSMIGWGIYGVIVIVLAVVVFNFTRVFIKEQQIFRLPGVPIVEQGGNEALPDDQQDPVPSAPEENLPEPWDGGSRVTILLLGLDERDWEVGAGAPRSDTMMLATLDPISKTAGMLSIPRDMWVNIPGYGYNRINMAYSFGEGAQLPGGGPGLAMKTVDEFIGVPIQYYLQVDFMAFEEGIDAMGGLDICIPEKIRIDPIGPKLPYNLDPGCQTLYGYEALAYARNRKTAEGDVDRAKRQQQVIMAIRDQVLSPENFPKMVKIAPDVYNEVAPLIRTNLSFEDALRLASLAQQIPRDRYKQGVIDYTMMSLDNVILGGQDASIAKPFPDKIRVLRDEIFLTGGAVSPIAQGTPAELMQVEGARVRVRNASYTTGVEQTTAQFLQSQGMGVTELGTGSANTVSVITLYSDKLYSLRYLLTMLNPSGVQLKIEPNPSETVDIQVDLGSNWAANPTPPQQ
ncbi:MAG: LCP family protein [Anaerolineales bacterium]|nr:LCP family protein [Anaerolineales bacterium]